MSLQGKKIGRYVLGEKLGEGGMGVVYLAVHEELNREVALKVLPEALLARSRDLEKRFLREASVCARLSHPNIVKIFDYGFEDGVYYYVMEVLRATSLEQRLRSEPVQSVEVTLRVARDLASAMECYFAEHVIHRDIKPGNVMLDGEGRAILTDFGLVKDLEATGITRSGAAVGTPFYMAPEMILGRALPASDIWQLGVVLYRMLTGQYPFSGTAHGEVFRQILNVEPRRPSELAARIPAPVETVVMNCLVKDPSARYNDPAKLLEDLGRAARRLSVSRLGSGGGSPPSPRHAAAPLLGANGGENGVGASGEGVRPGATPRHAATPLLGANGGKGGPGADTGAGRALSPELVEGPKGRGPGGGLVVIGTLAVLAGAGALLLSRGWMAGPIATDVRTIAGVRRALVTWQSTRAFASRVEWGLVDAPGIVLESLEETTSHRVPLTPLEPGREYRCKVLLPDGSSSLEYRFRSPDGPLEPLELSLSGGRLELAFRTPAAAQVRLRAAGDETFEPEPSRDHRLAVPFTEPASGSFSLEYVDATGDEIVLDRQHVQALFRERLLPTLADEVEQALAAFDPSAFLSSEIDSKLPPEVCSGSMSTLSDIGFAGVIDGRRSNSPPQYLQFAPGDPRAAELARTVRDRVESRPLEGPLRRLLFLAPGALQERALDAARAARLFSALRKLRQVDDFADLVGLPYRTGVAELFRRDYLLRSAPDLGPSAPALEHEVPGSPAWAHPIEDLAVPASFGDFSGASPIGRHVWTPELPDPSGWRTVELTLRGVTLYPELLFEVKVNDRVTLDYRAPPQAPGSPLTVEAGDLAMSFDPRVLRRGPNRLEVAISAIAGTRYLGLRPRNRFAALRLAWE